MILVEPLLSHFHRLVSPPDLFLSYPAHLWHWSRYFLLEISELLDRCTLVELEEVLREPLEIDFADFRHAIKNGLVPIHCVNVFYDIGQIPNVSRKAVSTPLQYRLVSHLSGKEFLRIEARSILRQNLPVVRRELLVSRLLVCQVRRTVLGIENNLVHLLFEFSDHVALVLVGPVVVSRFKRLGEVSIELINIVFQDIPDNVQILFGLLFASLHNVEF